MSNVLGWDSLDDPKEHVSQHIVPMRREMDIDLF